LVVGNSLVITTTLVITESSTVVASSTAPTLSTLGNARRVEEGPGGTPGTSRRTPGGPATYIVVSRHRRDGWSTVDQLDGWMVTGRMVTRCRRVTGRMVTQSSPTPQEFLQDPRGHLPAPVTQDTEASCGKLSVQIPGAQDQPAEVFVTSRPVACEVRRQLIDHFGLHDGPVDGIYGVGIDYMLHVPEGVPLSDSHFFGGYSVVVNADPHRFPDIPLKLAGVLIYTEVHRESSRRRP
jgi:hypothetical protein